MRPRVNVTSSETLGRLTADFLCITSPRVSRHHLFPRPFVLTHFSFFDEEY
jgi:hypothetical protein